ncbi:hypothetical protein VSDG_01299 [Cytospora chrysosperma]|uniref:SGNH hydrolase-type esterase domain-containing protein n=1 Tax=Cytospora chrysosperma TaxID=252740 RepID=A0A423WIM7_CYTCH|nr:hypothetical protein VSDG_01299 [Valsa sordida]
MHKTQAESSSAAATWPTETELKRTLEPVSKSIPTEKATKGSPEDPWSDTRKFSRYKARSLETSRDEHLLKILGASQAISVVFLGDSMIERMTTTGKTGSLQIWPSDTMWPETDLKDTNFRRKALHISELARISGALNAGCGGDKIENILYRLVGDPDRGLTGLAEALWSPERQRKIKLWVIQAGTNNLHPKKGLTDPSMQAYRALLESILDTSDESTHVLVTGLFYRKDIKKELVAQANAKLKKLVYEIAWELSPDYPDDKQQSTEMVVPLFDSSTIADAPQATKAKGKGQSVDPEQRRDSVIGIAITPTFTRGVAGIKEKGEGKAEAPPGTQEPLTDKKTGGQVSTHRDPTMPQFKPDWWAKIFEEDLEAVRMSREFPVLNRQETVGSAHRAGSCERRESGYEYPRIQFLPAPEANNPETWLVDHVHLHEEGYRLWTSKLFPKVEEMLRHAEEASS